MKRIASLLFVLSCTLIAHAQLNFFRYDNIDVLKTNGDTLFNAWAGGFNSVQFSEVDLDLDGIKDLFVFDRTGNRMSTFINKGTPNQVDYKHNPLYLQFLPDMQHWVLFRDFNCDGKMDIFTYYSGGIRIYKNTSTSMLSFAIEDSLVYSDYQPDSINPNLIPLYVSGADLPAIDDIDNDGDLDILTFDVAGTRVVYHKNMAMENYGTCDSTSFELKNNCWGYIKENPSSNTVVLFDTCSFNVGSPEKFSGGNKHSGSTLLTLDVDGNNSKDLVLGDVGTNNLSLLYNSDFSPNLTASSITSVDTAFPANNTSTIPVDMYIFPAGFYLDVDNDNVKDLISSTNCSFNCLNDSNVWLYKNYNATNNPDFGFETNSFLQEQMIEVGEGAHPVFFDYNADGLLDMVVGTYGVFSTSTVPNHTASLWLYENIGTANSPAFQLVTKDYLGISSINLDINFNQPAVRLMPTFGDLDGDGDEDLLIGDFFGYLHFFENTAGMGNPAVFVLNQVQYQSIDVGLYAAPQLIDLNRDNLLDLVIGERYGNFRYYENTGTSTSPVFTKITDTLGYVNTKRSYEFSGNSTPFIFDNAGQYMMLSGSVNGYIYHFGNIDGNLNGTFTLVDSTYLNIWEGSQTAIHGNDLDNDGTIDLLIGNYSGGVAFYKGDKPTAIDDIPQLEEILLYPNPAYQTLNIDVRNNSLNQARLELIDLLGKSILETTLHSSRISLNISDLAHGVYLLKFSNEQGSKVMKFIKR
ncbi:MAG: T9SS type A sorting domain-containing protein [Flavobacteriales bacterium]|nr:T9SS type A sorting domain-containing protein [Flavobacteriales bacterium]